MTHATMIKIASACAWMQGIGFGLPCIYGIWHLAKRKSIATFLGFPTYGHGPFERIGVTTTVPLLTAFLLVCALECVCGWGLWNSNKGSAIVSFAILPVEILFYAGFALPFGPPVMILRIVLLVIAWAALR